MFRGNLVNAMENSWNVTKENKEGSFSNLGLFHSQRLGIQERFSVSNSSNQGGCSGGNSWETIRRWCLQFCLKDDPHFRHTRLFIPNDEIRKKMEKYLEGFDGSKYSMKKHQVRFSELNKTKVRSSYFGDAA